MEMNEENLQALTTYLQQTMSPDINLRKPAEDFLKSVEGQQGYAMLLLALLGSERQVGNDIKLAAAIAFKNFIKRNWKVYEDSPDKIHPDDRNKIKQNIVNLMLTSPAAIQKQLSTAIAQIGQQDFPAKWQSLLNDMVTRFQQTGDFNMINGVLQTAFSIFEKYSVETKSQKLWEEIKFVLDNFASPFTELFKSTMELAKAQANNKENLKIIFGSLLLISKIFYFLNYQDLPEFFEDNMQVWMNGFHELLTAGASVQLLQTDDDDEPGVFEDLRSQICDNIGLYAHKYEEEFQPYMQKFVEAVWNLLLSLGPQVKYDMLTSNAIQFLASVADRQQYKSLFEEPSTLASICEKIIVPNMEMREIDVELFEDNPEEYIRRDLEGSDVDTRRRAACDLVKGLSKFFEPQITSTFGAYVQEMLNRYAADRNQNWRSKDAAIYLVTSLATKAKTAKHGITQTNQLVDLTDFCNKHIVQDLQNPTVDELPVLKASAIKYFMVFRSQLPPAMIKAGLPFVINHLQAQSVVTHTYAAECVSKSLIMKAGGIGSQIPLITTEDLTPMADPLLKGLFAAFQKPGSTENEYVMKCVMRSFNTLKTAVMPYLAELLPNLTQKLALAAKNPTKPHYNHYLFESLSISIRIVCKEQPAAVANFEEALFPVFQEILIQDVQEFVPYVFQVLSLLLEMHTDGTVPQPYMELFNFLLTPILWERPGNIKPLVRLLQAYVSRGPQQVVSTNKMEALLGIFQKLIASKSNDHEGFYLLQTIIEHLPPEATSGYAKGVFQVLFTRLTSSKTTKFVKGFLVFFFLYITKFGGTNFQEVVDSIQPNLFGMVVERLIVLEVQKITGNTEKKICALGMIKLLCETPIVLNGTYAKYWTPILQALVGFFELPEDDTIPDDEHFIEIEDTPGYQTAYSHLIYAGKRDHDPFAQVDNPKVELAQSLNKLSIGSPGMIQPLITQLQPEVQQHLRNYLGLANVNLL